jgi:hypothetical protein
MFRKILTITSVLLFLGGCVSAGQKFSAGEPKNSLPFLAKELIEELHSIAVPPFSGDRLAWHEAAQEVLAQAPKASLIPQKNLDSAIRTTNQDPVLLLPEERIEYVSNLGKSVQADAVLNGIILGREDRYELILQLVSSKDSRVLWFQAADFSFKDNQITKSNQKDLLSSMLSPLLPLLGKREKPVLPAQSTQEIKHKVEPVQKPEAQQKSDPQPKSDKKTKPSRKPDKGTKPQQEPEDVSPM